MQDTSNITNYDSIIATISAIVPVFNKPLKETFELEYELCKVDFPKDENARSFSKIKEDDEETFVSFLKRHVCYENEKLKELLALIRFSSIAVAAVNILNTEPGS